MGRNNVEVFCSYLVPTGRSLVDTGDAGHRPQEPEQGSFALSEIPPHRPCHEIASLSLRVLRSIPKSRYEGKEQNLQSCNEIFAGCNVLQQSKSLLQTILYIPIVLKNLKKRAFPIGFTQISHRYLNWLSDVKYLRQILSGLKKVGAVASHPHFVATIGSLVSKFQP